MVEVKSMHARAFLFGVAISVCCAAPSLAQGPTPNSHTSRHAAGSKIVDCNDNGMPDADDILLALSRDCNNNDIPDECDLRERLPLNLGRLTPAMGTVLRGAGFDEAVGYNVAAAGDVNGDDIPDLIVGGGRHLVCGENAATGGNSYVIFGGKDFPDAFLDLGQLDGSDGFRILQPDPAVDGPSTVSGAGDLNADGFDDLIIGLSETDLESAESAGACYVLFGGPNVGSTGTVDLADLDGVLGVSIVNNDAGEFLGWQLAPAGDLNDDGVDDVLIGVLDGQSAYVLFGGAGRWPAAVDLQQLHGSGGPNGQRGVRLYLETQEVGWGRRGSTAGDFNSDGIDDIIVAAPTAFNNQGAAFIVCGHGGDWPSELDLAGLTPADGVSLAGGPDPSFMGFSLAAVGDMNDDGHDDVFLGAPALHAFSGAGYLLFGGPLWSGSHRLAELAPHQALVLRGGAEQFTSGASAATGGDIDSDGVPDLILGEARLISGLVGAGDFIWVVYGGSHLSVRGHIELNELDGLNGYRLQGADELDRAGGSLAGPGDLNNDGFDDYVIGTPGLGAQSCQAGSGAAYVMFGGARLDVLRDGAFDLCLPNCRPIVASTPPFGAIDARQPFDPQDGADALQGWDQVTVAFDYFPGVVEQQDFDLFDSSGGTPKVTAFEQDGNVATFTFDAPLTIGAWTTVHHMCSGIDVRVGALPGDVDGNATSSALDILVLVDSLNGVVLRPPHADDIDRSGQTAPADILRLIDLLNGAGEYSVYNGASLPD